ncbi:hypothetical protein ROHU_001281 [Labeo rohita]|uniref:Uncharacterized protein n=1 Tax=Labeo rohita TaxID=84645 RepID=A0A498P3Z7_LABRO|nr:hypothetical protein ROHU_001281 [Labeo rohita]
MWSLACQARTDKGIPAWEGSRGNCWEIKTPGVAPGGGKRCGVWPTGRGRRKANPPGRALAATAGRSRLQTLHQAGERDVEFGLPGKDGQRQTRLGGLSWQLLRDQDSGHCTRRGGRDEEFGLPGREGERQTRLGVLSQRLMGDQDSGRCTRRGGRDVGRLLYMVCRPMRVW